MIHIYEDKANKPIVRVLWDPTPDIEGSEEASESDVVLMPGNWNRDTKNAWRMYVDIAIGEYEEEDSEE